MFLNTIFNILKAPWLICQGALFYFVVGAGADAITAPVSSV